VRAPFFVEYHIPYLYGPYIYENMELIHEEGFLFRRPNWAKIFCCSCWY